MGLIQSTDLGQIIPRIMLRLHQELSQE